MEEFINEAMQAGFTIDHLARAEIALGSGMVSSSQRRLPKLILNKMVERKLSVVPWQGPLPEPRVSPPRTLGDFLATAMYRKSYSSGESTSVSRNRKSSSPAGRSPVMMDSGSNFFENSNLLGSDPEFPSLTAAASPASFGYAACGADGKELPCPQGSDPTSPPLTGLPSGSSMPGASAQVVQDQKRVPDRIKLGPGKFYQPTKGLCALFSRTETKIWQHRIPLQPPPPAPLTRSFAAVVREGRSMAAQEGNGGGYGAHGGGRGTGFNPGFQPGFDPGFGGRGRGRDYYPRGRVKVLCLLLVISDNA